MMTTTTMVRQKPDLQPKGKGWFAGFLHEYLRVEQPALHLHMMTSSKSLGAGGRWVMSGTIVPW